MLHFKDCLKFNIFNASVCKLAGLSLSVTSTREPLLKGKAQYS
jgi:hypothetical protein